MTGYIAMLLALVLTAISVFYYVNAFLAASTRRSGRNVSGLAGKGLLFYRLAALFIAGAAGYLLYIILSDKFQFAYVFGYSSRDLSTVYKFSAFWAGQEGSFLLWALFHVIFGLILARKNLPVAMAAYGIIQIMLMTVLLAKSPFMMLIAPQPDGAGLNPLLQDPWMVIHPPVVFLGYAALAVPFAHAIDGLLTGRHQAWIKLALPWTLFSLSALGAGIFIGGFWAYKVLGWGGYWAWDPVENSSLVPWLACGALLHLLLLARARAAVVKPAYFAAIITFALVMYGTFLTRSGVLTDFSTHSFADEGIGGLLASFVLITLLAALGLLIIRWPDLPDGEVYPAVKSREFNLAAAALTFTAIGVIVLAGMSTPLVTMLLGNPQNINTAFYNTTTLPLAAVMALLLAVAPFTAWGGNKVFSRKCCGLLVLAGVAIMPVSFAAGIHQPVALVTVGLSFAALIGSLAATVRHNSLTWPAVLAHTGAAAVLIGIVFSSMASQSVVISLDTRESRQALDVEITYLGSRPAVDRQGFYQSFRLAGAVNNEVDSFTKLNKEGLPAAREPAIFRGLSGDIYVAPVLLQEDRPLAELTLHKGEQSQAASMMVKLIRLGMSGSGASGDVRVYALLETSKDREVQEAKPELVFHNGQIVPVPFKVFNQYEILLTAVSIGESSATIELRDLSALPRDQRIDVEISRKPLIGLVWLGTVLITAGTAWAACNRRTICPPQKPGNAERLHIE